MKSPCDAEQALAHTESFEYILFDEGFFEAGYIRKLSQSVTTTLATGWLRASNGFRLQKNHEDRVIGSMEDRAMRKAGWMLLAAAMLSTSTGCLIPMYSGDPIRRAQELIYTSEDLRTITDEWERIWFLDQPSHMTPYRTHGGIL